MKQCVVRREINKVHACYRRAMESIHIRDRASPLASSVARASPVTFSNGVFILTFRPSCNTLPLSLPNTRYLTH